MSIFKYRLQWITVFLLMYMMVFVLANPSYASRSNPLSYLPDKVSLFMQINFNKKNRNEYASLEFQGKPLNQFTQIYLGKKLSELDAIYFFSYPSNAIHNEKKKAKKQPFQMGNILLLTGQFKRNQYYRTQLKNKSDNRVLQKKMYKEIPYLVANPIKRSDQELEAWGDQLRYIAVLNPNLMVATVDKQSLQDMIDWFLNNPSPNLSRSYIVNQRRWTKAVQLGSIIGFSTIKDALDGENMSLEGKYQPVNDVKWISFEYNVNRTDSLHVMFHCQSKTEAGALARISKEFIVEYALPVIILASSDFSWVDTIEQIQAEQQGNEVILKFKVSKQQLFRLFSQSAIE